MQRFICLLSFGLAVLLLGAPKQAFAQIFPPGSFSIDGFPVMCGPLPVILNYQLPDVGMNTGQAIILNPNVLASLPTPLKMYWFGHECGHFAVGPDEMSADCWAVKTGRAQGWFLPQDFGNLWVMFQNNPGSLRHPPGPIRWQNMVNCFQGG